MPRRVIARSYGNSIFKYLRNFHTISIVGVPVYIPTNSAEVFPFLHTFSSSLLFVDILMMAILTGVRWLP